MYFRLQLKFRKTYFDTKQTISTSSANFQSSYIPRLLLTLMCEKLENIQRKEALKPGIDVSCQKDHILSWRELVSDSRLHKYALLTPPPNPIPPYPPPPKKKKSWKTTSFLSGVSMRMSLIWNSHPLNKKINAQSVTKKMGLGHPSKINFPRTPSLGKTFWIRACSQFFHSRDVSIPKEHDQFLLRNWLLVLGQIGWNDLIKPYQLRITVKSSFVPWRSTSRRRTFGMVVLPLFSLAFRHQN